MTNIEAKQNTDREIWREREGDYYADSIFVATWGGIGINCGGYVVVLPVREWHALAMFRQTPHSEECEIHQDRRHHPEHPSSICDDANSTTRTWERK